MERIHPTAGLAHAGNQHRRYLGVPAKPRGPRPQYGEQHQRTSAALIAEHRIRYGDMCPGLEGVRDAHHSPDLVADHLVAGQPEHGYQTLCRSCNSRRQALGLG